MNKQFIQQIVFAVAMAVIVPVYPSVFAQNANPTVDYVNNPPLPDLVLRKKNDAGNSYSQGIPWHTNEGYWIDLDGTVFSSTVTTTTDPVTGETIRTPTEEFSQKVCYLQDFHKPGNTSSQGTIGVPLETRAFLDSQFGGAALYIGVNTYQNGSETVSEFSTNQMRLGLGIIANENNDETSVVYDPSKAVDITKVYLGHGIINSRLKEGTYQYHEDTGTVDDEPDITIDTYSVVGMKGTLQVLPDSNQDGVFRSIVANNNKNRHIVIDKACTIIVPEGAKLEFLGASWDKNESHHPYSILPIYGEIVGDGKVQFKAMREDFILVYGKNDEFTGDVIIDTEDSTSSERYHHSAVVFGNGTPDTGLNNARSVHFKTGNLIIQSDQTLNNLSSERASTATTRIGGTDAVVYNGFVDHDDLQQYQEYTPDHNLYETLTLYNDKPTTFYGAIGEAYEKTMQSDSSTIHYYDFTGAIKGLEKTGNETLSLYCAGSDGGIRAESFVVSSGQVNFNGYFKGKVNDGTGVAEGKLIVERGAVFSPDSWGWGKDTAIQDGVASFDADIQVKQGGKIAFNFSGYDTGTETFVVSGTDDEPIIAIVPKTKTNDVITITEGHTFDITIPSIIDLEFMNNDPYKWATEDAKYLLIKGGGFENKDYSDMLINTYGNMQTLRQFGLLGEGGNLYLITRYYVPEPSTWAMMILGAAGLLFWCRKNGRR